MTFRGNVQKPYNRARTGSGGKMIAGGGIGTLLLVGLFLLMGGNPQDLGQIVGANQPDTQQQESGSLDHCKTGADANKYTDCRIEYTALSVDGVWQEQLPAQAGIEYTQPGLVIVQGAASSACGQASAATGPFYCPGDESAYFEVNFFDQLGKLGAQNTAFAQEYIVAHEFGHHIQKLEGTLGLSNYNQPGEDSNAVKIELQADCYAGIWTHYASQGDDPYLESVSEDQVREAIEAARAVGDDNIQQRSGSEVRPDMFTHGSSKQRQDAFLAGYRSGKMSACDTLGRGVYR